MREWLKWVAGFLLTFTAVFALLFINSMHVAATWLPVAFALAFYGVSGLTPRARPFRAWLSALFGTGCSLLWLLSEPNIVHRSGLTRLEIGLGLLTAFALVGTVIAVAITRTKPRLWPWVLLVLFGWTISYLSSSHGSADPMIDWAMRTFGLGRHGAEILIVSIRKTVHFTFYGLVGLTGYVAALSNGASKRLAVWAALLTALSYASFDEIRQSTMPDRGASIWDVMLDMAGAGAAVLIIAAVRPKSPPK